jgi:hypothetical protein
MGYIQRNLIGLDQLVNTLTGGYPDETLSARCGRLGYRNPYKQWEKLINALFYLWQGPDHCKNAYKKEKQRYQFPAEYRE